MITKLTLRNFKSVGEQVYDFTRFDLLVGHNNSGKSTVLQAMAIWQFCVDEFRRSKRTGTTGIQVVLPNFTALPVPEFNLLWKDRTDRIWPVNPATGKKKQEFVLIAIILEWQDTAETTASFGIDLRYHSPQTMYAIPSSGWTAFREFSKAGFLPKIAYVPPFSGLEPTEKFLDISPMRPQVGKGQPGSVLRNLLLRVNSPSSRDGSSPQTPRPAPSDDDWNELAGMVERWFTVKLRKPIYESTKDVYITVEYAVGNRAFDIISGGSGFHQTLTLLAFLFGYQPTTILLDEPDAHLHVNLQLGTQFLIATHAEEFARGVDASQIVSLLNRKPKRVESTPAVLHAMSDVSNEEIARLMASPYILYVEGESDERILRAWAGACDAQEAMDKVCFKTMGGGGKKNMKERADAHFVALQQILPGVTRLMLFDFDDADEAFHPKAGNAVLAEWKRKNIENYLLVPDAWRRAALQQLQLAADDLFAQSTQKIIDDFFIDQNLTLPPGRTWRQVSANVFSVVNGKKILFENADGLFQQLRAADPPVSLIREAVALSMTADEIHEDVHEFIAKVRAMTTPK
jgi:AAA ATPase domain